MNPFERFMSAHRWSKRTGPARGIFRCQSHEDKNASGTVTERADGAILICCHAGCSAAEVVAAVGLALHDLFPPREPGQNYRPPSPRPVFAEDALKACAHELLVAAIIARDMSRNKVVSEADADRLVLCSERITRAAELATGSSIKASQEAQRILDAASLRPEELRDLEELA